MMIGNWKWNLWFALMGMAFTFLLSIGHNPLPTVIVDCFYCFAVLYALGYLFRLALRLLFPQSTSSHDEYKDEGGEAVPNGETTGSRINMTTPEDDDVLMKSMLGQTAEEDDAPFSPLQPPRLARTDNLDTETMVKALRHLSEE